MAHTTSMHTADGSNFEDAGNVTDVTLKHTHCGSRVESAVGNILEDCDDLAHLILDTVIRTSDHMDVVSELKSLQRKDDTVKAKSLVNFTEDGGHVAYAAMEESDVGSQDKSEVDLLEIMVDWSIKHWNVQTLDHWMIKTMELSVNWLLISPKMMVDWSIWKWNVQKLDQRLNQQLLSQKTVVAWPIQHQQLIYRKAVESRTIHHWMIETMELSVNWLLISPKMMVDWSIWKWNVQKLDQMLNQQLLSQKTVVASPIRHQQLIYRKAVESRPIHHWMIETIELSANWLSISLNMMVDWSIRNWNVQKLDQMLNQQLLSQTTVVTWPIQHQQ